MLPTINIVIAAAWMAFGLVCLGLSFPLIAGWIGRNPLYGVRFREAYRSDEAWFAINRYGGQRFALWSLAQIACGIGSCFAPLQGNDVLTLLVGIAPLVFVLIPLLETWRFARRLVIPPQIHPRNSRKSN